MIVCLICECVMGVIRCDGYGMVTDDLDACGWREREDVCIELLSFVISYIGGVQGERREELEVGGRGCGREMRWLRVVDIYIYI
jgi:hypothetical protein